MSKLKPKIVLSRLDGTEWTRKGLRPFLEYRDLGLAEATEGRVGGTIGRAIKKFEPGGGAPRHTHNTSFHLIFVMRGWFRTEFEGLGEVIALLKANPGKYSYGSSGVGTMPHLAGELFKSMAGVDIVHVPYRGNSAIMADLFAGRVAIMFDGPPTQLGNIREGKVRALATTTAERSPVLPAVPPVADTLPGYAIPFWTAIFAPANTPKDVVERIAAETGKAMKHPDVLRRYGDLGIVGVGSSPQELDRFWRAQLDYLGKIVKDANIKPVE